MRIPKAVAAGRGQGKSANVDGNAWSSSRVENEVFSDAEAFSISVQETRIDHAVHSKSVVT